MMFASLIVEALSLGLGQALYMINFERLTDLDGYWPTSGVLEETRTALVPCAKFCANVSGCRSLWHAEKKGYCECHGSLYNASSIPGLSTKATAGYYENKGTQLACPSNDQSFRYAAFPDGTKFQYRFLTDVEAANFTVAVAMCVAEGGSLMQVVQLQKFNYMRQLMQTCPRYQTKSFWVDGLLNDVTGHWETLTAAPLQMTADFWFPAQPDNYGGNEFCVTMYDLIGHMLNDRPCDGPMAYPAPTYAVCEKP